MANEDSWWEYPDYKPQTPGYEEVPGPGGGPVGNPPPGDSIPTPDPIDPTDPGNKCGPGLLPSPYNSAGQLIHPNHECVDSAEYDRRMRQNISDNPNKGEGGGQGQSGNSGGGGGGGVSRPPQTKSPYDAPLAQTIYEQLQAMIRGEGQPFSPEVVAKLNAGALGSNKAQLEGSQRDLQKRLINAGLSRSGVAPAEQGRLRSRADAALGNDFRNIAITAIQGNYAAKAQALAQAQTFLNSERANALSTDQLTLAYKQLEQQWKMLQAQFDEQKWIVNTGNEQAIIQMLLQLQNGGL